MQPKAERLKARAQAREDAIKINNPDLKELLNDAHTAPNAEGLRNPPLHVPMTGAHHETPAGLARKGKETLAGIEDGSLVLLTKDEHEKLVADAQKGAAKPAKASPAPSATADAPAAPTGGWQANKA